MSRLLKSACVFFYFLSAPIASAADAVVGGVSIALPAPSGFVEVSPKMPRFWRYFQLASTRGYRILAAYIPKEDEAEALADKLPALPPRNINVQVSSSFEQLLFSSANFAQLKQQVVAQNTSHAIDAASAKAVEDLNGNFSKASGRDLELKIDQRVTLPIHENESDRVAYSFVESVSAADTDPSSASRDSVSGVVTTTLVNVRQKVLSVYVTGDVGDLAWTRDAARVYTASILTDNPNTK